MTELTPIESRAALRAIGMAVSEGGWEWTPEETAALDGLIEKLGGSWGEGGWLNVPEDKDDPS